MCYKNPYESLKTPFLDDSPDYAPTSQIRISTKPAETIFIFTVLVDGAWIYGYQVYWANAQTSLRQPSKNFGLFRSERDARLHCIGFLKAYLSHFLPETADNIRAAERRLNVTSLPLFDEP